MKKQRECKQCRISLGIDGHLNTVDNDTILHWREVPSLLIGGEKFLFCGLRCETEYREFEEIVKNRKVRNNE
jgi:hypothetical protein